MNTIKDRLYLYYLQTYKLFNLMITLGLMLALAYVSIFIPNVSCDPDNNWIIYATPDCGPLDSTPHDRLYGYWSKSGQVFIVDPLPIPVPDNNPWPEPFLSASDTSSDTSLDVSGLNDRTPFDVFQEFKQAIYDGLAEDVDIVTITRHFIETEIPSEIFCKIEADLKDNESLMHKFIKKTEDSVNVSGTFEIDVLCAFKTGLYSYNSCLLSGFDEGSLEFDLLYQQVYEATEPLVSRLYN